MRRTRFALAAFAALSLALAPALAEARPGGGASSGSRGTRTYAPPPPTATAPSAARPFDRTATEPSRPNVPASPGMAARPGAAAPAGGSWLARNPLAAGLMGGLLGAGLFGMLSGGGLFGGLGSMAGFMGLLLQLALIGGLVFLVVRLLRGRAAGPQPALAGMPRGMAREMPGDLNQRVSPQPMGGTATRPNAAIAIAPADFEAFQQNLLAVNAAWSRQDETALRRLATPEMADYFANDLADLGKRGWRNETADVVLEQGDLAEAWHEAGRDFATVAMRFSLVDVTRRTSDGTVVEGDPATRRTATELWTFVRVNSGPWLVSAIQQTR